MDVGDEVVLIIWLELVEVGTILLVEVEVALDEDVEIIDDEVVIMELLLGDEVVLVVVDLVARRAAPPPTRMITIITTTAITTVREIPCFSTRITATRSKGYKKR